MNNPKEVTHFHPAWAQKANACFDVRVPEEIVEIEEQLWGRNLPRKFQFELCCIPFYAAGYALGDEVLWNPMSKSLELIRPSGRMSFRVILNRKNTTLYDLNEIFRKGSVEFEWWAETYGSWDAKDEEQAVPVCERLNLLQEAGELFWENGN